MKAPLFIIFLMGCFAASTAQIVNGGFEAAADTNTSLPKNWGFRKADGFNFYLDEATKHEGRNSFHLQSVNAGGTNGFAPFSQVVSVKIDRLQKLTISAFIKTKGLKGDAGLWCQVWDKENKKIGFANLQGQGISFAGDQEWGKYSLNLVVDTACKKLLLGGYIQGTGDIWYDDFAIEHAVNPAGSNPPSKEVSKFITRFTDIVRNNSIYSEKIDWNSLQRDISALSTGMTSVDETSLVTGYVLSRLQAQGDNHSFIMNKARSDQSGKENVDGRPPSAKMLDNGVGYIYVPGFFSTGDTAMEHFAQQIQALIRDLDSGTAIKGWIVDLRENTGGNMYPMIAGLGPLTGEGTLGYFVKAQQRTKWFYYDGVSGEGKAKDVRLSSPYSLKNAAVKIAVLIGPHTSSSGEMTTISFIGKPNVRLFGQPTGGYTTANSMFKLSNGSMLLLATSYCADRTSKKYMGRIEPDVAVGEMEDVVSIAEDWLRER